jgi:hypothetical protein
MRLSQLSKKVAEATETKLPNKPDPEKQAALESIRAEMHKTMLTADALMRKLEQILEK